MDTDVVVIGAGPAGLYAAFFDGALPRRLMPPGSAGAPCRLGRLGVDTPLANRAEAVSH